MNKLIGSLAILAMVLIAIGASPWLRVAPPLLSGGLIAEHARSPSILSTAHVLPGASVPEAKGEGHPRVTVESREFDFEIMDPGSTGKHSFTIRNSGVAPLKLQAGPTTCKCAVAELSDPVIAPGDQGIVQVEWATVDQPTAYFSQSASVLTNDPADPEIRFTIKGKIRIQAALDPPALVFARVDPDSAATTTALMYSQVWDDFAVVGVETSLDGVSWQVTPAGRESLEPLGAKSGHQLRLTLPSDLPQGYFSHWLRLELLPSGGRERAVTHEVEIVGRVLRRLCIYGQGIDDQGVIWIGPIPFGRGAQRKFLVKVRDRQRELEIERIETTPDFLQARLVPHESSRRQSGLYELQLEVPSDAPPCLYLGASPAGVRIDTTHPRIGQLVLPVQFSVVPDQPPLSYIQ